MKLFLDAAKANERKRQNEPLKLLIFSPRMTFYAAKGFLFVPRVNAEHLLAASSLPNENLMSLHHHADVTDAGVHSSFVY